MCGRVRVEVGNDYTPEATPGMTDGAAATCQKEQRHYKNNTLLLHARKNNGSATQRCHGETITTRTSHLQPSTGEYIFLTLLLFSHVTKDPVYDYFKFMSTYF